MILLPADTPRAPDFIVTVYGDVVEPRGGTLWMGALIECCAEHGISESLVRTAVSRLVGSGRLEGVRRGRKSYYRLSSAARAEFRGAARILFEPSLAPEGWLVAIREPGGGAELRFPWARIGSGVALAPGWAAPVAPDGVTLAAQGLSGDMAALAAQHWPLAEVAVAYRRVLDRYAPLAGAGDLEGRAALALRLRLVDDYRRAALADPRLPASALPPDWPAEAARALFLRLYLALTPAADRHVAALFADQDGPLPEETEATRTRLERLHHEAAPG